MSQLVDRLSSGPSNVSVSRYKTKDEFLEAVNKGFVLVRFTETQGGTELGFEIDGDKSELDAESNGGHLRLVGPLVLDYVPVTCDVSIDVASLSGQGQLKPD
ncbi:MAG: hypothetical protein Tsb002_08970 [Wenzhouxiangellaceae bacterium]